MFAGKAQLWILHNEFQSPHYAEGDTGVCLAGIFPFEVQMLPCTLQLCFKCALPCHLEILGIQGKKRLPVRKLACQMLVHKQNLSIVWWINQSLLYKQERLFHKTVSSKARQASYYEMWHFCFICILGSVIRKTILYTSVSASITPHVHALLPLDFLLLETVCNVWIFTHIHLFRQSNVPA